MFRGMRRSGTVGFSILLWVSWACGDHVVVARGVTLVSAAQLSEDAGIGGDGGSEHEGQPGSGTHDGKGDHHPPPTTSTSKPRPRH
jgi:hypothetical protein